MPKPIPGTMYTIVSGDTLTAISLRAYGRASRYKEIYAANETVLRSGDEDLIFPGEVIFIPGDTEIEAIVEELQVDLAGKDPNDMTLVISGQELPVSSGKVVLTADTAANGWTATRALDPNDPFTREHLRPFSYAKSEVYLGGRRVDTGFLYRPAPSLSEKGRKIDLHGWSKTANIIDSVVKSPFQENRVTLKQRAESMLKGRDVKLLFESENDATFKRVKASKTQKIFDHLDKLAKQRGIMISCTNLGELIMYDPTTDGSIGSIEEGTATFETIEGDFDGRERFNSYLAYGKGPKKNKKAVSKDNNVPLSRMTAFEADDTTDGDIALAADYYRNKKIADSLTIPVPVGSWYGPDGKLWTPNTLLTVVSPTLFLYDGFTFMIRSVEFDFDEKRTGATLNLIPPTVFTKGDIVDPWAVV